MKGGLGNLMKQAQQMQADMQKAQEELASYGSHRSVRRWPGKDHHDRQA